MPRCSARLCRACHTLSGRRTERGFEAKRLDNNGDGKISQEELAALHPVGAHEGPAHNPGKPNKPEAAHGGMHQPAKK